MRSHLLLVLVIWSVKVSAQHAHLPLRRTFPSISSYSQKIHDPLSINVNQAQLSSFKQAAFELYSERRFMLKELSLLQCAFVFPHHSGGYGLTIAHAGNRLYNETTFGLGFGKQLSDMLSLGVQFNYYLSRTAIGLNASSIGFETSVLIRMSDNFQAGFRIANPLIISKYEAARLSVMYSMGFAYDVAEKLILTGSVEKQSTIPSDVTVALRYLFHPAFYVSTGSLTRLHQFFLGVGLLWENKKLELIGGYHTQIGFTPALTFIFPLGQPKQE
jgi:hypothetical protein